MGNVVYGDLYFLINFSMDFLCFFLTSALAGKKMSALRVAAASALGGIYAVAELFLPLGGISSLLLHISVCALMCIMALCRPNGFCELPFYMLVYTALSLFLGGFMTALFRFFDRVIPEAAIYGETASPPSDSISVYVLALLAALGAIVTVFFGRSVKDRMARKRAEVVIEHRGKTSRLSGMSDTGNLLREPISGRPCIVASPDSLCEILPREMIQRVKSGASADKVIGDRDFSKNYSLRIIPAHTATGASLLLGFIPDKIYIDMGRGEKRVDAVIVLGIMSRFSSDISALLPSELMV